MPVGMLRASDKVAFTSDGGIAIRLINKTSAASVKGRLVALHTTTSGAYMLNPANGFMPIGVEYETGIADGSPSWIVVSGIADVLLEDTTSGTTGYWVGVSTSQAGRANAATAAPPGGGIPELDRHTQEIGHCIQTITGGTDVLCRIIIHFN